MEKRLDGGDYIELHIFGAAVFDFLIYKYLFKCVPSLTYRQSFWVFLLIQVIVMAIGILITWKDERNCKNMLENFALSWGVFVCIAYRDLYSKRIKVVLVCFLLYTMVVSVYMLFMHRKLMLAIHSDEDDFAWPVIPNYVVDEWRKNFAIASLVLILPIGANMFLHGTIMNASTKAVSVYSDEDSLKANIDIISNMDLVKWNKLSIKERLNACQKIANCEGRYLGLSHELNIGMADFQGSTVANYEESRHQIMIDISYLSNPNSYIVLKEILHECYHAYQIEQVRLYRNLDKKSKDLLMFSEVSVYEEELINHRDGGAFTGDEIEKDAEEYAKESFKLYYEEIREYLNKNRNEVVSGNIL